jgi:hypothetical protein
LFVNFKSVKQKRNPLKKIFNGFRTIYLLISFYQLIEQVAASELMYYRLLEINTLDTSSGGTERTTDTQLEACC